MSWFDVVVAILFIAGLAGGYIQGLIRQSLSLATVVCGLILGTYLRVPLAAFFAFTYAETAEQIRETAAFWLAVVGLITLLEIIQRKAVPETHLLAIGIVDRIGGVLVSIVTVCLQLSVAILVLRFFVALSWPIGNTLRLLILQGMKSSITVPALYNLLVGLVTFIGALLPEGKPRFLTFV
jgi:uncharacterized membrane protein required for colicin V production